MQTGRRTKHSGQKCIKKMTFFKIFKFPAGSGARTSRRNRNRNTEAGCRHRPEEMAGDAAGDTSWERRTR
ncbi:unnamed protein product [Staurois parvus]|uniref:Uncharacterized protein n=1 Tax=Staurois parvus TaxID=386267 RepID=A0ABN9DKE3_9NEOB|nr:unnamed protein product [Staurois parvus]